LERILFTSGEYAEAYNISYWEATACLVFFGGMLVEGLVRVEVSGKEEQEGGQTHGR